MSSSSSKTKNGQRRLAPRSETSTAISLTAGIQAYLKQSTQFLFLNKPKKDHYAHRGFSQLISHTFLESKQTFFDQDDIGLTRQYLREQRMDLLLRLCLPLSTLSPLCQNATSFVYTDPTKIECFQTYYDEAGDVPVPFYHPDEINHIQRVVVSWLSSGKLQIIVHS